MRHVVQRLGIFRMSRGVAVLLLLIGAAVAAAFWVGPFRPLPARLSIYLPDATMDSAANAVRLDPVRRPGVSGVRFPLVFAVRNDGARAAAPTRINLSVPHGFRVVHGLHPVTPEITPGNPLARFRIDIPRLSVAPDSVLHQVLTDTLWLEPYTRDYDCTAEQDSIPEFTSPVVRAASALATVPVFYSFDGTPERQTGTFIVHLDSTLLRRAPTPQIPVFPTYSRDPEAPRPAMGLLTRTGRRSTTCGDAFNPVHVASSVWETKSGGRLIELSVNGAPRKHLFDLNRDSIVELEMWDQDHNGKFESWRQASYPLPTIVLPERLPLETVANDSLINDPSWLAKFDDPLAGPYRFLSDSARVRRTPVIAPDTLAADSVARDSTGAPVPGARTAAPPSGSPAVRIDSAGGVRRIVVDSVWLRKFNNPASGPYRFLANPPARRAQPAVDTTRQAPARPRNTGPRPLGRPVPFPGPGGTP